MAAAKRQSAEPRLPDVLEELSRRGLLGRTTTVVVGSVQVHMHPHFAGPAPGNETTEQRERREEREAEDLTYASS